MDRVIEAYSGNVLTGQQSPLATIHTVSKERDKKTHPKRASKGRASPDKQLAVTPAVAAAPVVVDKEAEGED